MLIVLEAASLVHVRVSILAVCEKLSYSTGLCIVITEKLKLELTQRHMAEMDQLSRTHRTQMAAAKMELERSIEIKSQQVGSHCKLLI